MRKIGWILGILALGTILPTTTARAQLADPGSVGVAILRLRAAIHGSAGAKLAGDYAPTPRRHKKK